MQNIKKYFMTLALLLTAVTGAWAAEKMVTINSSTMSSGAVTATGFNIFENYLYVSSNTATITTSEGVITKLVIKKGDLYGDGFTEANVGVTPGTITYGSDEITVTDINAESVTLSRKGSDNWSTSSVDVYYGEPTEWPLTSQDGKTWTLAKMPASNIELQVEYYAESNLFLGKEALADKANISVLNGSTAVTFDDEGKSTTTVTEGNTVTVTYTGTKKIIGVKAEKKAGDTGKSLAEATVGMIIGSNGKAYAAADKDNLPKGVKAEALVCYVDGNGHGLALALADEDGTMNWSTAQTTCTAHTPAITGGTWKLASEAEWNNMISAAGSDTDLREGFSSVGGTNMQSACYWSSTEFNSEQARDYDFDEGEWSFGNKEATADYVRACLAF